ncbi:alginate lyase family protein [Candidatus Laterigemmans baculatus]|uniref:alginate lyase family protein n=1 Tax=Candidatus Laterigemmans baculatus TaxID=2770505 RepID=UPI0013D92766|nr:alginate lyase family protein [Candidatus Laterigemmans baculatus]
MPCLGWNVRWFTALLAWCGLLASAAVAASAPPQTIGIWTSPEELRAKPIQGPAWEAVFEAANQDTSRPDVSDKDDRTNTRVLAAAIVFARTGDTRFRAKVVESLEALIARGRPAGRTLAWARETGAYVMAADLVQYRTTEFEAWLRQIADVWEGGDGRTLRTMFHRRPNNWGSHAFGTLCAIDVYLGDRVRLAALRDYWVRGIVGPNPGYRFGDDLSWHPDPTDLRFINPAGAQIGEVSVDGLVPDDMRRGDSFRPQPVYTGYAWEVLQGQIMAARILERQDMPIWHIGDRALYRAAYALQERLGGVWAAKGDDRWMLPFLDEAYETQWSEGHDVWGHGKNTGWAYVLDKR